MGSPNPDHLLEIYKLYARLADNVGQRREGAHRLFASLNVALMLSTAAIVAMATSAGCQPPGGRITLGLMARVNVPKSVSLGGLNQARPQGSQRDRQDDQDRQALDLDVGRRLYSQVRQARVDALGVDQDPASSRPDSTEPHGRQGPDTLDGQALPDGLDPRRLTPRQRAAIYDLENPQPELHPWARVRDRQARQALDPGPPARRPTRMTPQRRAALYDLFHPQPDPPPPSPEVINPKAAMLVQALDDNRRNRRNRPVELTPRYERLVEKLMARRQARRQATAGVRNVGMRDSQPYRLPKVVVYNDSSAPRAPRSPR